jgi:hypothetical protein
MTEAIETIPSQSIQAVGSYELTRFNATRHGILSRHAVLPWEDRSESACRSTRYWAPWFKRMAMPRWVV